MELNKLIDHTYLKPVGTQADIQKLIDEAKEHHFKSVCIEPCHVAFAAKALEESDVLVCTVIGFPLGANTTETKVFETYDAIAKGADEIDMVINIGAIKEGRDADVLDEINQIAKACEGHVLKVIIETCYLTEEEIIRVSELVGQSNATFIKTSTGFGSAGATKEHVKLMKKHVGTKEVKAAGGVRTSQDLSDMVEAGATRIGTSNGVALMQGKVGQGY